MITQDPIAVGSVVLRGTSDQRMTISSTTEDDRGHMAVCQWFDAADQLHEVEFELATLRPAPEEFTAQARTFGFETALHNLRGGRTVQRTGWNGKGLVLKLQVPDAHSKMTLPYIYMEYPTDVVNSGAPAGARVPWLASQTDLLATDWQMVAESAGGGN